MHCCLFRYTVILDSISSGDAISQSVLNRFILFTLWWEDTSVQMVDVAFIVTHHYL